MLRQSHNSCHGAIPEGYATCEADLFAGYVLGKGILPIFNPEAEARANRERLEELAPLSPRHAAELQALLEAEAEAKHERELLEFAAQISTRHRAILDSIEFAEAEAREKLQGMEEFAETLRALEAGWEPSEHPRAPKGQPDGGQWVDKGGGGGASGAETSLSFLDAAIRRNQTIAGLSGVVTPGMIQANGIATELRSAARLPGEVARWASDVSRAAAAGLGTGGKAVVNGFATAVKSVATLGLSTSQLELIGVTKEDRARGYDTAVAISTASGQVLIAVGTGGITSALSKGGSVARAASGALILYDAAGNAVGVVQGVYDASQNGVSVANGVQVAGGLLGPGANAIAARTLKLPVSAKQVAPKTSDPYILFNETHAGSQPIPRGTGPNGGRLQSHHGLQQEWAMKNIPGYDSKLAPTMTIETGRGFPHTILSNLQNLRRDARIAAGYGKWSSTIDDELGFIVNDFRAAGFSDDVIRKVLHQNYRTLDKLGVKYNRPAGF